MDGWEGWRNRKDRYEGRKDGKAGREVVWLEK